MDMDLGCKNLNLSKHQVSVDHHLIHCTYLWDNEKYLAELHYHPIELNYHPSNIKVFITCTWLIIPLPTLYIHLFIYIVEFFQNLHS